MKLHKVISRVLIPAAVLAEACDLTSCRRTDLPIYMPEPEPSETTVVAAKSDESGGTFVDSIENTIGTVRRNVMSVVDAAREYEQTAVGYVNEGVDQTKWLVQYLGDEENQAPKGPAIAIGGLTGFIFALRGGLFKKIIYTTAGAVGMAAVCYPREAAEYGRMFVAEGTQIATIAYNFIYGERNEEQLVLTTAAVDKDRVSDEPIVEFRVNPGVVVSSLHAEAEKKSCHCPVGGCLSKDGDEQSPSELPYPPSVDTCPPCSDPSES